MRSYERVDVLTYTVGDLERRGISPQAEDGRNRTLRPHGVVIHEAPLVDSIYWADAGAGAILGLRLDGSAMRVLVSGLQAPEHIALDATRAGGAILYWGDSRRNVIERCVLGQTASGNCSSVQTVLGGVQIVAGLALDPVAEFLYWADGASFRVRRAPLDGDGGVRAEAAADVVPYVRMPSVLALEFGAQDDPQAQALFYIDQRAPASIWRYSLTGNTSSTQPLVEFGLSRPRAIAIALQARSWFAIDSGTRELAMASLDDPQPSMQPLLRDVTMQPRGLACSSALETRQTAVLQASAALPSLARPWRLLCGLLTLSTLLATS